MHIIRSHSKLRSHLQVGTFQVSWFGQIFKRTVCGGAACFSGILFFNVIHFAMAPFTNLGRVEFQGRIDTNSVSNKKLAINNYYLQISRIFFCINGLQNLKICQYLRFAKFVGFLRCRILICFGSHFFAWRWFSWFDEHGIL